MKTLQGLLFLTLVSGLTALGWTDAPAKPAVGEAKPGWENLPGVDGKNHSLAELSSRDVVVVAVTCNHCPIAAEYVDRMKQFAKKRCGDDSKVALVAVSVSQFETDKLPRMKEAAKRRGFNFPYLYDESQEIARKLGASVTPEFFVLDKQRTLVYRGAWDDNVNEASVKQRYVELAVDALLAGNAPPVKETRARGCPVDYE